jgi:hypothetical protein
MREDPTEPDEAKPQVGMGYAGFQLARALATAESHPDPSARERANDRVSRWTAVLLGTLAGSIKVGARTPIRDVPAWATLEVVTGGFATGAVLSGGPLRDHERELLVALHAQDATDPRRTLNSYFLSESGLAKLQGMLESGLYDVQLPEEGALLVVAWLLMQGHSDAARSIVDELAPHFPTMRFYPAPGDKPRTTGSRVCVETVGATTRRLRQRRPNQRILAQREAVAVWTPLYDRVIALFVQTVVGELPMAQRAGDGSWLVDGDRRHAVVGGWPCATYPAGWVESARAALLAFETSRAEHRICGRPNWLDESMGLMLVYLRRCIDAPDRLSGRDVGKIRLTLARYLAKRGLPGADACRAMRKIQVAHATAPTHYDIAKVVLQRLARHAPGAGLDEIAGIVEPVAPTDTTTSHCQLGTPVPRSIGAKVARCQIDTPEALVERRIITSGEMLASVLPQITSGLRAQGIADPALRQLYAAIYRAFRQRRSLLLLDLQKQVQIGELPWVAAIDLHRAVDLPAKEISGQALKAIATLAITSFPETILPNKLLQEMDTLAKAAELDLPLTEEVASDIFMGRFSAKFPKAARVALALVGGTLYGQYYGIEAEVIGPALDSARTRKNEATDAFAELCALRARASLGGLGAAKNGKIIEQQQILTTHNLATLFDGLGLSASLQMRLDELAKRCFNFVIKLLQVKTKGKHEKLIHIKKAAYAWRQMVFFTALLPRAEIDEFIEWCDIRLGKQPEEFRIRFRPALDRLVWASEPGGDARRHRADAPAGAFLGWSTDRHWLM